MNSIDDTFDALVNILPSLSFTQIKKLSRLCADRMSCFLNPFGSFMPKEIQSHILSYLDYYSLKQCCLVCKDWKVRIEADVLLWKNHYEQLGLHDLTFEDNDNRIGAITKVIYRSCIGFEFADFAHNQDNETADIQIDLSQLIKMTASVYPFNSSDCEIIQDFYCPRQNTFSESSFYVTDFVSFTGCLSNIKHRSFCFNKVEDIFVYTLFGTVPFTDRRVYYVVVRSNREATNTFNAKVYLELPDCERITCTDLITGDDSLYLFTITNFNRLLVWKIYLTDENINQRSRLMMVPYLAVPLGETMSVGNDLHKLNKVHRVQTSNFFVTIIKKFTRLDIFHAVNLPSSFRLNHIQTVTYDTRLSGFELQLSCDYHPSNIGFLVLQSIPPLSACMGPITQLQVTQYLISLNDNHSPHIEPTSYLYKSELCDEELIMCASGRKLFCVLGCNQHQQRCIVIYQHSYPEALCVININQIFEAYILYPPTLKQPVKWINYSWLDNGLDITQYKLPLMLLHNIVQSDVMLVWTFPENVTEYLMPIHFLKYTSSA